MTDSPKIIPLVHKDSPAQKLKVVGAAVKGKPALTLVVSKK